MGGRPAATEGLSRALCVEKKNYAFPVCILSMIMRALDNHVIIPLLCCLLQSQFYTNDDLQSSASVFGTTAGQKDYSYTEDATISVSLLTISTCLFCIRAHRMPLLSWLVVEQTADVSIDRYYDQNDTIAAFRSSSQAASGFISNGPGFFQLPQNDFAGACNDLNYVGFEVNVRNPQSCDRYVDASTSTSFQSQCQRDQSVDRYVTDLYLARNAELQASSGVSSASEVIGVEIQRVFYYDSSTDTTSEVTTSYVANDCDTTYYSDVRTSSGFVRTGHACLFTSNSSWTSIDTSNANTTSSVMFCANIVKDVVYYVNHSTTARGTIQQVLADVTITDLAATTSSYPVVFAQSFAIEFTSVNTAQQTTDNGNLVTR